MTRTLSDAAFDMVELAKKQLRDEQEALKAERVKQWKAASRSGK
jgi:hypothetical protein